MCVHLVCMWCACIFIVSSYGSLCPAAPLPPPPNALPPVLSHTGTAGDYLIFSCLIDLNDQLYHTL